MVFEDRIDNLISGFKQVGKEEGGAENIEPETKKEDMAKSMEELSINRSQIDNFYNFLDNAKYDKVREYANNLDLNDEDFGRVLKIYVKSTFFDALSHQQEIEKEVEEGAIHLEKAKELHRNGSKKDAKEHLKLAEEIAENSKGETGEVEIDLECVIQACREFGISPDIEKRAEEIMERNRQANKDLTSIVRELGML